MTHIKYDSSGGLFAELKPLPLSRRVLKEGIEHDFSWRVVSYIPCKLAICATRHKAKPRSLGRRRMDLPHLEVRPQDDLKGGRLGRGEGRWSPSGVLR